jgi:hypothetical protein
MQEQMTKIEISMSYRLHFGLMTTLVAKISLHMYTNENLELQTWLWLNWILVAQFNDQLIISLDTQSYRPINDSIENLRTSKCMHPIQMMDTLRKFFNLEVQLGF